jgi:hypothetical protein
MIRVLKILSILSIAGIVLLSLFTWYSCDDYCNKTELARYSIFKMAWLEYMNWDGRSLTISSFVQLIALKYFPVELTTFIWAACFIGVAVFIFKIIQLESPAFIAKKNSLIMIGIFSSMLWLGLWKLIPDVIYWSTGGSYSLLTLLGLAWLFIFLRGLKNRRFNNRHRVSIFFLSLFLGMNSHNFILGLFTIACAELGYYKYVEKDSRAVHYIAWALTGLFISACIVFLAPGNQIRLHSGSHIGVNWNFITHYSIVFARYIYWLAALVLLCVIVLWICGQSIPFNYEELWKKILKKQPAFLFIHEHKYFLAAMATISVFFVTAYFAVPRTAIFFASFLVIAIFQKRWKRELDIHSKRFLYGGSIFLCLFIGICFFQMKEANAIKQQLKERETIFNSGKGNDIVVTAITKAEIPFAFTYVDISPDTSYWVNRCVARHFELKTVKTGLQ